MKFERCIRGTLSVRLSLKVDHNIGLTLGAGNDKNSNSTLSRNDNGVNEHFTFIHFTLTNGAHVVQHGVNTLNGRGDSVIPSEIGVFEFVWIRQKVLVNELPSCHVLFWHCKLQLFHRHRHEHLYIHESANMIKKRRLTLSSRRSATSGVSA